MNREFTDIITLSASLLATGGTVYAALKSAVAAKAAEASANVSIDQFYDQLNEREKQEQERKKIERPILTPLSKEFNAQTDTIFRDWDNLDRRFSISDQYSAFSFEVFNTGKSFALDVHFSFELLDINTSIPDLSNEFIQIEKREDLIDDYSNESDDDNSKDKFYMDISEKEEQFYSYLIEPFEQFYPLVESGKSCKVNVHFYFILLNNIFLKYGTLVDEFSNNIPKLKLIINYKDQYDKPFESKYIVKLCNPNSYNNNNNHNGRISFELIS